MATKDIQEMNIQKVKISELKPAPYNPRKSNEKQEANLKASLEKFGVVEPIIFNKQTGFIVGGHFRVRELKKLGIKEVDCVIVDLSPEDEKELNIRLNANTGEWDWEMLNSEWDSEELEAWGLDVPEFGAEEVLEAVEDDFDVTPPEDPITVLGDLYEIGEHRLLSGDSTDSEQVARLMNGEKADMVFTDPPYNGDVSDSWDNQWKDWEEFNQFIQDTIFSIETNTFFIFGSWKSSLSIYNQALKNKINFLQEIVWMKPASMGMLYWFPKITEYAQVFYKEKDTLVNNTESTRIDLEEDFLPKSDLRKSMYEKAKRGDFDNTTDKRRLADKYNAENGVKPKNVWFFKNMNGGYGFGGGSKSDEYSSHPTIKPVKLCERGITAFSKQSSLIIDPFLGSGSTMVASHQLKRKCYGMELDPKYCDVIVRRMLKLDPNISVKRNGVDCKSEFQ
jgi:DNA modification methylase